MADYLCSDAQCGQLRAPRRNRYFYGKLLDVRHLEMEQAYEIWQRRLVNRLGLGAGVLCGLELELGNNDSVSIAAGVAIDGCGREIVVPAPYCIEDAAQPTDDDGKPMGDRVQQGIVEIYLCYAECADDPTAVLVGDCDSRNGYAAGSTVERFKVVLRERVTIDKLGLTDEECEDLFPPSYPPRPGFRQRACETLDHSCDPPDDACVALGVVEVSDASVIEVDSCSGRNTVYSNSRLFDILCCLAEAHDECCGTPELRYAGGDAQTGDPGDELTYPLQTLVTDHSGYGIDDVDVTFLVQAGGGSLSSGAQSGDTVVVTSSNGGLAEAKLTLGNSVGPQSVEATIEAGGRVMFSAWANESTTTKLPRVVDLRPRPAEELEIGRDWDASRWARSPYIAVSFDHKMDQAQLEDPEPWLRGWLLREPSRDAERVEVERMRLAFDTVDEVAGEYIARYRIESENVLEFDAGMIQIRAETGNIVSADDHLLLDADFKGSDVTTPLLDELWRVDAADGLDVALWHGLNDTRRVLPSGDGSAGGLLHSWFKFGRDDG